MGYQRASAGDADSRRSCATHALDVMKRVDATYTVNTERQFQARNSSGFEIELSMPATLAATLPRIETLFPIPLPEQDWLLPGRRCSNAALPFG
jgi:hypothetical protein